MGAKEDDSNAPSVPRSVRHKRIIDAAADQPDASFAEIAEEIPSATTDLVENVLEEYGDPAEDDETDPEALQEDEEQADSGPNPVVTATDPSELSKKERKTLQVIHENPELTQSELGEILGVSNATVCNRVNDIQGFEWATRQEFTADLFDTHPGEHPGNLETMEPNGTEQKARVDELADRVATLEERVTDQGTEDGVESVLGDPELSHKVIHACIQSDAISEEEELDILKTLLG